MTPLNERIARLLEPPCERFEACPRCWQSIDLQEDRILTCPSCGDDCCTRSCIAGVGVTCFRCEEAAEALALALCAALEAEVTP